MVWIVIASQLFGSLVLKDIQDLESKMKEVLALIEKKKQEFAQLPFFMFLQDKSIDPRQRLAFAPYFAPFVMGFGELNKYSFRNEQSNDSIQAIVNQHTYEDDYHWLWFLDDLKSLGFDQFLNLSDALRLLWSEETRIPRQAVYELHRYTFQSAPIQKFVVIEAIEATADIFLSATTQVAQELETITGEKYSYFGSYHSMVDSGHTMHSSETEECMEDIQLKPENRKKALILVRKVFGIFTELMNGLYVYARTNQIEQPLKPVKLLNQEKRLELLSGQSSPVFPLKRDPELQSVPQTKRLGDYLIEAGLLTNKQLEIALDEQQRTDLRLGAIIHCRGWLDQQTVEYLMEKVILPERESKLLVAA